MPRVEILRGFGTFKEVFQSGKRFHGEHIHCHVIERSSLTIESLPTNVPVLVGFSISRKIRTAVERNRLRRLLREAYRTNKHELSTHCLANGQHLVLLFSFWDVQSIIPKKIPYGDVEKEVTLLLSKIKASRE